MSDPIEASGINGQITFDGDYVTINRKGMMARATVGKGEKRIPISSITAVQWKPPSKLIRGFIQFTVPGGTSPGAGSGSRPLTPPRTRTPWSWGGPRRTSST